MTTASSCCAVSRQTSHPECSTRSGANRSHSYLPPERLPLAAAFAGFRTNAGYAAIRELWNPLLSRRSIMQTTAGCSFPDIPCVSAPSGITMRSQQKFCGFYIQQMVMRLCSLPHTQIYPLSTSGWLQQESPFSHCAGTTRRYCGNSRAPPEPSSWQPALRGKAWTSPATACRCLSFPGCRLHSRTPSTSMKRETIPPCVTSSGASSCRKCRSSSSRASDAPSARKRTPAWLPS